MNIFRRKINLRQEWQFGIAHLLKCRHRRANNEIIHILHLTLFRVYSLYIYT